MDIQKSVLVRLRGRDYRVYATGEVRVTYWRYCPKSGTERRVKRTLARDCHIAWLARYEAKPLIASL